MKELPWKYFSEEEMEEIREWFKHEIKPAYKRLKRAVKENHYSGEIFNCCLFLKSSLTSVERDCEKKRKKK